MSYIQLIAMNRALIQRIDELERDNKKAMETIGLRITNLETMVSSISLPKPLFERETNNRMTIDELSTNHITNASELFEELILPDDKEALLKGLDRHLDNLRRERSSSQGDTDLLAKKRMPH